MEIYELSENFTNLPDPGDIDHMGSRNQESESETPYSHGAGYCIKRINEQEITNSKDIRKLRQILKDPVAKGNFVSAGGTIESASRTLAPKLYRRRHTDFSETSRRFQNHSSAIRGLLLRR